MEYLNPRRSLEVKREELSKEIKAIRDEREKLEKEKEQLQIENTEETLQIEPDNSQILDSTA